MPQEFLHLATQSMVCRGVGLGYFLHVEVPLVRIWHPACIFKRDIFFALSKMDVLYALSTKATASLFPGRQLPRF